jgi:hypothetical protein
MVVGERAMPHLVARRAFTTRRPTPKLAWILSIRRAVAGADAGGDRPAAALTRGPRLIQTIQGTKGIAP